MIDLEERKKVVYIELSPESHRVLCDLATSLGIRIAEVGAQCIDSDLARRARLNPNSLEARLFAETQDARRREGVRSQLRRIAWGYLKDENEQGFDKLAALCDEAGVSIEETLSEAQQHKTPPMLYGGGKLAEAVEFLHELGRAVGELPSTEIIDTGAGRGLSSFVLKQAKKEIGITSKRRPQNWVWVWPNSDRIS